jgi:hypothetical protein
MPRWSILVPLGVVALAGVSAIGRPGPATDAPLTATGHAYIITSADGLTTAVTIDTGDTARPPDGKVEHAFRLQHVAPRRLAYDGLAVITYEQTRVMIETDGHGAWLFSVENAATDLDAAERAWMPLALAGLSHHWGDNVRRAPEDVATWLLATGCMLDAGDCEDCEGGGPGSQGCFVECGEGSGCSAHCGSGSYACCNCPDPCKCCRVIDAGAANAQNRSPQFSRRRTP